MRSMAANNITILCLKGVQGLARSLKSLDLVSWWLLDSGWPELLSKADGVVIDRSRDHASAQTV